MSNTTYNLTMPYIQGGQAQKHITHNDAIRTLDTVVQLSVVDQASTPPTTPLDGARYIVGPSASGDFVGRDGQIALHEAGGWTFVAPLPGWIAFDQTSGGHITFDGSMWASLSTGGGIVAQLGVNTAADATNKLAVSADAVLLTHDTGGGHQLKINKATIADSASLLFQTGYSGRAEFGTTGNDGFSIKLSGDGATWIDALSFDPTTGAASGASIQQSADDITAGRLALAQHVYGPGNLLGTVSQTAGQPTGAVVERGNNAQGTYVRFADGTQICTFQAVIDVTAPAVQTFGFAASFATAPAVSANHISDTPNTPIELGNLRCLRGDTGSWRVSIKTTGTVAGDPDEDTLILNAIGRWF